jgi:WD40 repeat protein
MNANSTNKRSNFYHGSKEISPVKEHHEEVIQSTIREGKVSGSQQSLMLDWAEEVTLEESRKCRNFNITASQAGDSLLCGVFVEDGKCIAVGSKDKNIYVYESQTGKLIAKLQGHKASVCCLLNHR